MKTNAVVLLFLGLLTAWVPAVAKNIGDVAIPDTLALPNSEHALSLNGAGIRKKFFMDIYIGALYLPAVTTDSKAILADSGAASVLMHFVYKEVSKDKIVDGWNDGLRENLSSTEFQALSGKLEKFNALFKAVRNGDTIRIDYNPAIGTEVRINDEWRGSVEGNDFFRALLKIWIGEHPVSSSLKKGMLGIQD
ncbi:MAG: chalcone isomerase family protein [Gammaproteobacteria bacterium]